MPKLTRPQIRPFTLDGPPRLLSKKEIVAFLGISPNSLWRWMRAGKFPRGKVMGQRVVWLSSDVAEFVARLPAQRLKRWEAEDDELRQRGRSLARAR